MRSVSIMNQPPQKMFMLKNKFLVGYFDKTLKGDIIIYQDNIIKMLYAKWIYRYSQA